MLLLFFLMVALGMLSLLWLYFPVEGVQPADPLPPRPQVSTPAPPAEAPAVPTAAAAAGAPATVTDATGGIDPAASTSATGANPAGTPPAPAPALPTPEELDRQLEKLLGLSPAPPSSRP